MLYMLDTNILIYLMKHQPPQIIDRINALMPEDQLCMSFITYAELYKGAEGSDRKAAVLNSLAALTAEIPVNYSISSRFCQLYAEQATRLKRLGTPIGANDLWIASHALAESATLVSHNVREFARIDGLLLEDWVD